MSYKNISSQEVVDEMKRRGIYDAWCNEPDEEVKAIMQASQERAIRVEDETMQRFIEMTDEDKRSALKKQEDALIPLAYEHSIRECKRMIRKMKKILEGKEKQETN